MEQPQYNLLHRNKVEDEFARLYGDIGLGLTTWSPLASGVLTGKYLEGVPEGSRATRKGHGDIVTVAKENEDRVRELVRMAEELDVSTGQLALAWVAANPHVSTVILGASSVAQLEENLGALTALERLTPELKKQLDDLFA